MKTTSNATSTAILCCNYLLYLIMKTAILATLIASAAAFAPAPVAKTTSALSETKADLQALAGKLNPAIKFFDPLNLSEQEFWGTSNEATIGFLRESEVKHGRIAMFAFVGYIVHANGITWPWAMTLAGDPFPQVSSAPEAWDAIPEAAKWQIIMFVGFLEYVSNAFYWYLCDLRMTLTDSTVLIYLHSGARLTLEPTTCPEERLDTSLRSMPSTSQEAPSTSTNPSVALICLLRQRRGDLLLRSTTDVLLCLESSDSFQRVPPRDPSLL